VARPLRAVAAQVMPWCRHVLVGTTGSSGRAAARRDGRWCYDE